MNCSSVLVRGPRDTFGHLGYGPAYFAAGGIGITPLTSMVTAALAAGIAWHLLFVGKRRESMVYADALVSTYGTEHITIHASEEVGHH